jgi:hypothetical protein
VNWVRRAASLVAAFVAFVAARRWLFAGTLATGTALAATTLTLNIGGGGGEAPAGTAHLWVDTNGGTCTRQASPATYSDAAACSSLDAAQDAASGGDTVRIVDGSYGAQDITGSKASTVTYIGESVDGVTFTGAINSENKVQLEDLTIVNDDVGFIPWLPAASDQALRNVRMEGDYVQLNVYDVDNFSWVGGRLGDFDGTLQWRPCTPVSAGLPFTISGGSNALVEGLTFSEMQMTAGQGGCTDPHWEMLRVQDGTAGVTIRRNIFLANTTNTAVMLFSNTGGSAPTGMKIVRNIIDGSNPNTIFENSGPCLNWVIAYNTIIDDSLGSWGTCSGSNFAGTKFVGNISGHPTFGDPSCADVQWVADFRQSPSDGRCTTGDDSGNNWVTGDTYNTDAVGLTADGHLSGSSPALDAGETVGASDVCTDPAIMGDLGDIDGDPLPTSGDCDAGADEYVP